MRVCVYPTTLVIVTSCIFIGTVRVGAFVQLANSASCSHQSSSSHIFAKLAADRHLSHLFSTTFPKDITKDHNDPLDLTRYSNAYAFNRALDEIANQCLDDKPNQHKDVISLAMYAEALLLKVQHQAQDASFKADVVCYNTVIKVWARVAQCLAEGRGRGSVHQVFHSEDDIMPRGLLHRGVYSARDAAERASSLVENMEQRYLMGLSTFGPNVLGYNTCLDAWCKSKSRDSGEKCEELMKKMLLWSEVGPTTSIGTASYMNHEVDKWKAIRPNAATYALCMDALSNSEQNAETLNKILSISGKLQEEYDLLKDPSLKPDIRVANRIINAYGKSNHAGNVLIRNDPGKKNANMWIAAKKAHEVFTAWNDRYKLTGDMDFKPDTASFTSLIDSYGRCGDKAAAEKAQMIFDSMMKEWKGTGDVRVKPSSRTFTSIITAWSKSPDINASQKAEELLHLMEDLYRQDVEIGEQTTSQLKPNIRTYTAAICTWANSKHKNKAQEALRILKKCLDYYKNSGDEDIKPTLYTYNCCISACATLDGGSFEEKSRALKIAFSVHKTMLASKVEASPFTYNTLLKVATNLMVTGKERDDIIEALFLKCHKTGLVDESVLKTLRIAASNDLYNRLLGSFLDKNGGIKEDAIPKEWSRKVRSIK